MYRKFTANHIFTGHQLLGSGQVLITGSGGVILDVVPLEEAGDGVQEFAGLLCPGFINAHCHLELSHMKGHIPEHTGMVDFILKVVNDRHYSNDEILAAIETAETEMLHNGIVAVGDICNNTLTIAQKSKQRLQYYNFIEASGFPPAVAAKRFAGSAGFYRQYSSIFPNSSIVPHAPYSVSPELFSLINEQPGNRVLTMHNQESPEENELFQLGTGDFMRLYQTMQIDTSFFKPSGKTSLQTVLPGLTSFRSLILVHNVCSCEQDLAFAKQHTALLEPEAAVYYCLCPGANLYISNRLPDAELLLNSGANIVLGTDSLASNHQLSILEEMKILQQHFPAIPLATMLTWATLTGASALQLDKTLGSFDKGKQPGVLLIDMAGESLAGSSVKKLL